MMNRALALLAFLALAGFLLILGFSVPSPDLLAVIALVLLLVAIDMWKSSGKTND